MSTGPPLLIVTTRSRLRTPARFGHMWLASMRIRRQLGRDADVVRWASVVAGPREFWTITVWRSRHPMLEFMRSGAHDDIMWLFSRWLESFWLMRWRPESAERGSWDGLALAPDAVSGGGPSAVTTSEDARTREDMLARALDHLPRLAAATGPDGSASFDSTPAARRRRAEVAEARAVLTRITVPLHEIPAALAALRRVRRDAGRDGSMARAALGVGSPGDVYLLTVWSDVASAEAAVDAAAVGAVHDRWPQSWTNLWMPENEFGSWDGLRLRRNKNRYAVTMPPEAMALDALD